MPSNPGFLVYQNPATPIATAVHGPTWRGSALNPPTVLQRLEASVFDARGMGTFPLGDKLTGVRGTLELVFTFGASGTARTLAVLTDDLASPTNYILISLNTSNYPVLTFKNASGTTIAAGAFTYGFNTDGQPQTIRISWDSVTAVYNGRHVSFTAGPDNLPEGLMTTDAVSSWTSFQPAYLILGSAFGANSAFNGKIKAFQASNTTQVGTGELDYFATVSATLAEPTATATLTLA